MHANTGFWVQRHAVVEHGAVLFQQGEPFKAMHVLVSGCARLREVDGEGMERLVALCLPGELLGLEGWTHGKYLYTAVATGPVKVCQLRWPGKASADATPPLLERLLRKAAAQIEYSRTVWTSLPAVERVQAFLDRFAQRTASRNVPLTRREIGSLLGLAEETVVRAMRELRLRRQFSILQRAVWEASAK